MLHALLDYAQTRSVGAEPGFKPKTVRWLINFNSKGQYIDVFDTTGGDKKSKGRTFRQCPDLTQPEMAAAGEGCRHFLVDGLDVVAMVTKDGDIGEKLVAKHQYFTGLLLQAAEDNKALGILGKVASVLGNDADLERIRLDLADRKAKPTDLATVAIVEGGDVRPLVETSDWHTWWRSFRTDLTAKRRAKSAGKRASTSESPRMRCVLSGEMIEPLATHNKIEGLSDVGGLPMGDALTSFDKEAFCSFGLEQGANAAMSESVVKTYVATLNDLIKTRSHRLAGVKIVYWYSGEVTQRDDVMQEFISGFGFTDLDVEAEGDSVAAEAAAQGGRDQAESRAKKLLDGIRAGERPDLADFRYYAISLSGNSGRVVMRDWMEGPFTELAAAIDRWFNDLDVVGVMGSRRDKLPRFETVVTSVLPERKPTQKYEDWIQSIGPVRHQAWHCAADGRPLQPMVARRVFDEFARSIGNGEVAAAFDPKGDNRGMRLARLYARVGLLKLYLVRAGKGDSEMLTKLNEDFDDPNYQFGRLVAVLTDLQRQALRKESGGTVKASIVDRYFASACTTPKLVHGRLIILANHHLRRLAQKSEKAAHAIRRRIADISDRIDPSALPRAMRLEDQSVFALGYYHQVAEMNRARADANGKRQANQSQTKKRG